MFAPSGNSLREIRQGICLFPALGFEYVSRSMLPDRSVHNQFRIAGGSGQFVLQDKSSAVPYHGFDRFSGEFGRFWSRKGSPSVQSMVPQKPLFERSSQQDFSENVVPDPDFAWWSSAGPNSEARVEEKAQANFQSDASANQ